MAPFLPPQCQQTTFHSSSRASRRPTSSSSRLLLRLSTSTTTTPQQPPSSPPAAFTRSTRTRRARMSRIPIPSHQSYLHQQTTQQQQQSPTPQRTISGDIMSTNSPMSSDTRRKQSKRDEVSRLSEQTVWRSCCCVVSTCTEARP